MVGSFDERAYLQANPDVSLAVQAGLFKSGAAHYEAIGRSEGRPLRLASIEGLITPDVRARANVLGAQYGCSPALHKDDYLLAHLLQYSRADGLEDYFREGYNDAHQAEIGMRQFYPDGQPRVLEFASGYGRVTRHLKIDNLTASDVHQQAGVFTATELGVRFIPAPATPEPFTVERFDYVFVLSLFSHLPDRTFGPWLSVLLDLLTPSGYLMFTTHAEKAAKEREPFLAAVFDDEKGYGFVDAGTDQPDLETPGTGNAAYGSMATSAAYVARQIRSAGGDLVSYRARCWWDVQDEWVVRRW
jgi:SAM-dependent methyltransferase